MCEYCGCRDIPELDRLGREHDHIEDIAENLLAVLGGQPGDISKLLVELRAAVTPHVDLEEKGVFVQAKRVGIAANYWVEDLEADHERFAMLLTEPSDLTPTDVESFLDDLHRHIAIEEYDLFPALSRTLTEEDWSAVSARVDSETAGAIGEPGEGVPLL